MINIFIFTNSILVIIRYDFCRNTCHNTIIRDIIYNYRISSNNYIISNSYVSYYLSTCKNYYIISNSRISRLFTTKVLPDCSTLEQGNIITNRSPFCYCYTRVMFKKNTPPFEFQRLFEYLSIDDNNVK